MVKLGMRYQPLDVLPHRGGMMLLDAIRDYGEDWLEAEVSVRAESGFAAAGGVPAWVGVEYMAQAVCAWSGIGQVQRGEAPSPGLLLGSRRYQSHRPVFAFGSRLRVRVQLVWRDANDLAAFDCAIAENGETVAQAQLKVYRPRDLAAALTARTA
jgi:predicted hotdog family 3-hydroxylacyl-ACP dehydratase